MLCGLLLSGLLVCGLLLRGLLSGLLLRGRVAGRRALVAAGGLLLRGLLAVLRGLLGLCVLAGGLVRLRRSGTTGGGVPGLLLISGLAVPVPDLLLRTGLLVATRVGERLRRR